MIASIDRLYYASKSFATLDCISDLIKKWSLSERKLAEYVFSERSDYPSSFLCVNHKHVLSKVRVITDTYFNNELRKLRDTIRKDNIKDLKQRQTKRERLS